MRYVFVSDIHGEYDKLIAALRAVDFDAAKDTIVSCGDPFDRGPKSWEVLKFLLDCPHRILIWGNHDLRLRELVLGIDVDYSFDKTNGVLETMKSFCGPNYVPPTISMGLALLRTSDDLNARKNALLQYFNECVFAVEWSNLIATHAWIPVNKAIRMVQQGKLRNVKHTDYSYRKDWRFSTKRDWENATWEDAGSLFKQGVFIPDRTLVIGHWHTFRLRGQLTVPLIELDCSTFKFEDKLIALDGCSNLDEVGRVNAYVYETDEVPISIGPKVAA